MGMMSPAQASVAQLDRVLPSEGRGRGFESRRVHQIQMKKPQVERPGAFLWAQDKEEDANKVTVLWLTISFSTSKVKARVTPHIEGRALVSISSRRDLHMPKVMHQ